MIKYYCASPFFNKKERRIRDLMITDLINYEKDTISIFRPDKTYESDEFDKSPSEKSAQKLLDSNLKGIEGSDNLVFPKFTNDLGTLFEVGYAINLGKKILAYNYLTGEFDNIYIDQKDIYELTITENKGIVDLGKISSAVLLGYNYDIAKNLGYYLPPDTNDNIMLMRFTRYDQYKNKPLTIVKVKVDIKYGNTSNGEKCERIVTPVNIEDPYNVHLVNCNIDDRLVLDENGGHLERLISRNLDFLLGKGQSIQKLFTGVS